MSRKRKRSSGGGLAGGGGQDQLPGGSGGGGSLSTPSLLSGPEHHPGSGEKIYLADLLREAKSNLQQVGDPSKRNGVTYALFGSSGSGKSTI
jgi:ABC-type glutathione transport system ATPase component